MAARGAGGKVQPDGLRAGAAVGVCHGDRERDVAVRRGAPVVSPGQAAACRTWAPGSRNGIRSAGGPAGAWEGRSAGTEARLTAGTPYACGGRRRLMATGRGRAEVGRTSRIVEALRKSHTGQRDVNGLAWPHEFRPTRDLDVVPDPLPCGNPSLTFAQNRSASIRSPASRRRRLLRQAAAGPARRSMGLGGGGPGRRQGCVRPEPPPRGAARAGCHADPPGRRSAPIR